jgi:hypothetical protein
MLLLKRGGPNLDTPSQAGKSPSRLVWRRRRAGLAVAPRAPAVEAVPSGRTTRPGEWWRMVAYASFKSRKGSGPGPQNPRSSKDSAV